MDPVPEAVTVGHRSAARVVGDAPYHVREIHQLGRCRRLVALGARQRQDVADELVHAIGFRFHTVQVALGLWTRLAAREGQRHVEPGQRRAQLVRHVRQQSALRVQQRFESAGHRVEVTHQIADFVAARPHARAGAGVEVAGSQTVAGIAHEPQRTRQVARHREAHDA